MSNDRILQSHETALVPFTPYPEVQAVADGPEKPLVKPRPEFRPVHLLVSFHYDVAYVKPYAEYLPPPHFRLAPSSRKDSSHPPKRCSWDPLHMVVRKPPSRFPSRSQPLSESYRSLSGSRNRLSRSRCSTPLYTTRLRSGGNSVRCCFGTGCSPYSPHPPERLEKYIEHLK